MPLRAIYQGRYRGAVVHADNAAKPLCLNHSYLTDVNSLYRWVEDPAKVSCKECLRLLKAEGTPLEKQTLRERLKLW